MVVKEWHFSNHAYFGLGSDSLGVKNLSSHSRDDEKLGKRPKQTLYRSNLSRSLSHFAIGSHVHPAFEGEEEVRDS